MKYTVVGILMAITATLIPFVQAETSVINNVSISSKTGGNNTSGSSFEGEGKANVFIETFVNGKVVEFIDEELHGDTGEAVFSEVNTYENEDGTVRTKTNVFLQTSEPTEREEGVGETFKNTVETQEKQSLEENAAGEEKSTFLAVVFQKFRVYVLSIFN